MSKELGSVFRTLRNNCTFTQQQVADALHLDRSTYAYYERGTTEPDLKTLKKIATIFNVDPALLLPDEDGRIAIRVSDVTEPAQEAAQENEDKILDPHDGNIYTLTKEEKSFLAVFRALNKKEKRLLRDFFEDLYDGEIDEE